MLRNFATKAEVPEISDNSDFIEDKNLISNPELMVTNLKNEHHDLLSFKEESVLPIESIYVQEASVPVSSLLFTT